MKASKIIQDIQKKTQHLINTRHSKLMRSLEVEGGENEIQQKESESIADITFEVSEKIIKQALDKICKQKIIEININTKYKDYVNFLINELTNSIEGAVIFDTIDTEDKSIVCQQFKGFKTSDGWFIGEKNIKVNNDDLINDIKRAIRGNSDLEISQVKKYIDYGFKKAMNVRYVILPVSGIESLITLQNN